MKPACTVMASGRAKRFGRSKLLEPFCGVTLLGYPLQSLPRKAIPRVLVGLPAGQTPPPLPGK